MSFYENKPRKAKYAFQVSMSRDILSEGLLLYAIHEVLKDIPESPEVYFVDYRINAGTHVMLIYINDDALYQQVKTAIAPYWKG